MKMELEDRLARLEALQSALRSGRPRPEARTAWYCASALLTLEGEPEMIAASVRTCHQVLKDQLGRHSAPTGQMRWAYAAILVGQGVGVERLVAHRDALREARSQTPDNRKTGALHAGGARAALVLSACGLEPADSTAAFFQMKQALNPPWWRRSPGITDLYCAAHVAGGDDPRIVAQSRKRAVEVFKSERKTRGHKHTGAKACALYDGEPRTVLRSFLALDETRRANKSLRGRVSGDMQIEWAAQGLVPEDLTMIADLIERLPRTLGSVASGRSRLAHLILTHGQARLPLGEVRALAAIIAAQTAAMTATMVAITSASSAANANS